MKVYLVHRIGRGYHDESWTDFTDMSVSVFLDKNKAEEKAINLNCNLLLNNDYYFRNKKNFLGLTIKSSKQDIFNKLLELGLNYFCNKMMDFEDAEPFNVTEMEAE